MTGETVLLGRTVPAPRETTAQGDLPPPQAQAPTSLGHSLHPGLQGAPSLPRLLELLLLLLLLLPLPLQVSGAGTHNAHQGSLWCRGQE